MRGAVARIEFQIFSEGIARGLVFFLRQQGSARPRRAGAESPRAAIASRNCASAPGRVVRAQQHAAQREVEFIILGRKRQRGAILLDGFREFPGVLERETRQESRAAFGGLQFGGVDGMLRRPPPDRYPSAPGQDSGARPPSSDPARSRAKIPLLASSGRFNPAYA